MSPKNFTKSIIIIIGSLQNIKIVLDILVENKTYETQGRRYDHISPILKELKKLPVRQHLYYRHAIMAFKCMTECAPDSLFSKYIQRVSITKHTTRNSQM